MRASGIDVVAIVSPSDRWIRGRESDKCAIRRLPRATEIQREFAEVVTRAIISNRTHDRPKVENSSDQV